MAVRVKAAENLLDPTNGDLLVKRGTGGTVSQVSVVGNTPKFLVDFDGTPDVVTRWVGATSIVFDDGKLGPLRAFLEGSTRVIEAVGFITPPADFSAALSTGPIALSNEIQVLFAGGGGFRIVSDRNTGDLNVTLLG